MATIRPVTRIDLEALAALRLRCFDTNHHQRQDLVPYLDRVFFGHPWHDAQSRGWVHVEPDGAITGYVGAIERPWILDGAAIKAATFTQFMVDPKRRKTGIGNRLVAAFLAGPQDFSLTDVANDRCRRVWESHGGLRAWPYCLTWSRTLRPVARRVRPTGDSRFRHAFRFAAMPLAHALDRFSHWTGRRDAPSRQGIRVRSMSNTELVLAMTSNQPAHLYPVYDETALEWLVALLTEHHGIAPRRCAVDAPDGARLGWFVTQLDRDGVCETLQLGANDGCEASVVAALLSDAWRQGAEVLRGAATPGFIDALTAFDCSLRRYGPWLLVHSRLPKASAAFHEGRALFSRLDGEWWIAC